MSLELLLGVQCTVTSFSLLLIEFLAPFYILINTALEIICDELYHKLFTLSSLSVRRYYALCKHWFDTFLLLFTAKLPGVFCMLSREWKRSTRCSIQQVLRFHSP